MVLGVIAGCLLATMSALGCPLIWSFAMARARRTPSETANRRWWRVAYAAFGAMIVCAVAAFPAAMWIGTGRWDWFRLAS